MGQEKEEKCTQSSPDKDKKKVSVKRIKETECPTYPNSTVAQREAFQSRSRSRSPQFYCPWDDVPTAAVVRPRG